MTEKKLRSVGVHLFAGGGGMAIGLRSAGFGASLVYEYDPQAHETLKNNGLVEISDSDWKLHRGDVRKVSWSGFDQPVDVLAGGVPCQPFSLAGKHLAERDGRNMFPEFFRAAACLTPRAMFVENVFGLTRKSFEPYFQYILRRMECPSVAPRVGEVWESHDERLQRHQASRNYAPEYHVEARTLNAADYGIPQIRRRVFIVGTRADLPQYEFPEPTHSKNALLNTQACGAYWDRHEIPHRSLIRRGRRSLVEDGKLPWLTVRDALMDLPEPTLSPETASAQHWLIPGAKSYRGHTGSILDWPSKALKAGVHGVPGGENTVIGDDGLVRYYTFREAARIQTFPDTHVFSGGRRHLTRQIGNAVPCFLAEVLARGLNEILSSTARHDKKERVNA